MNHRPPFAVRSTPLVNDKFEIHCKHVIQGHKSQNKFFPISFVFASDELAIWTKVRLNSLATFIDGPSDVSMVTSQISNVVEENNLD